MRAHGAWVYLFASVAAGALVGAERGVERAMLVGTGFAGAFLVTAALVTGGRRKGRQVLVGSALAVLTPLAALWLGRLFPFGRFRGYDSLEEFSPEGLASENLPWSSSSGSSI